MKRALIGLAIALLLVPFMAYAAEFKPSETSSTVTKNENPTNLYIGGQTVNVDGDVKKDLVAGGNTINVNGNVESSIIAGGYSVNLNGNVGDNVRVAGNTIVVKGRVDGDITAVGKTLSIEKGAVIAGDVMIAGSSLTMNGTIEGDLYFGGSKAVVNGEVKGEIKTTLNKLTLGNDAVVGGKLTYWSPNEANIANEGNVKGGVEFHKETRNVNGFQNFWIFTSIVKSIGLFIILLLIVWLMPRFARNFTSETYRNLWPNLGWGAFTLFVIPIIAVLLLITFFGIPLAFVLGLIYLLVLITAGVLVPLVLGSLLWKLINRGDKYEVDWKVVLLGVVATFVLQFIPVLGWLTLFVFFLFALGEVTLTVWGVLRKQRT
jgi:cytoskeletal protein CcmA (bactofilin family)